jgi:hypothetical protein
MPLDIDAALDKLSTDYGVKVAVAELLRTNLYDRILSNIQTGQYLDKEPVGGVDCDHVAFVTPDADWEAWFQTGDRPVLRKFSIAYRNAPSRPRYTMLIDKFDTGNVSGGSFVAAVPPGSTRVDLAPNSGQTDTAKPADSKQ